MVATGFELILPLAGHQLDKIPVACAQLGKKSFTE